MPRTRATVDHQAIREWVQRHGGRPAAVAATALDEDPGVLRLDFPGEHHELELRRIEWERFFEWFEADQLALVYGEAGGIRFCKLVSRYSPRLPRPTGRSVHPSERRAPRVVKLLDQQHRAIETWFSRVKARGADQAHDFDTLADVLAAHTRIEEQLLYPALLSEETDEMLQRFAEDHLFIKRMLTDLLDEGVRDSAFTSDLDALEAVVRRHVGQEEQALLPLLGRVDPEMLAVLAEMMAEAFEGLMEGSPRKQLPGEMTQPFGP